MESTPDDAQVPVQPLRDADATSTADSSADPAQAEWERTEARDRGASVDELEEPTATGGDPDEIPSSDDEVPAEDLPGPGLQPESQGEDPTTADLGDDGQGDLGPGDV
jgi:hypothetical protein